MNVEAIDTLTLGVLASSLSSEDELASGSGSWMPPSLSGTALKKTTAVEDDAP
jgi:hypothetical protein